MDVCRDTAKEDREMLLSLLEQNLEQARHVENERMMFNTLFAATLGVAIGMREGAALQEPVLFILAIFNLLTLLLTARWNKVFGEHIERAVKCYGQLAGKEGLGGQDENTYYLFRRKEDAHRRGGAWYIHTGMIFLFFNCLTLFWIGYMLLG